MRTWRLGAWSRRRSVYPAGRREPAALRGLQVGEQAQLAVDLVVPDPDHLAGRYHLPWWLPGRGDRAGDGPGRPDPVQPGQRLRCHAGCLVPRGQGTIEFGPDLVGGADVDRARRDQRLRDQRQRAGRTPAQGARRGRAAQFGLGQLPQVGFRASAVHVLSVLPVAHSSFLAVVLGRHHRQHDRRRNGQADAGALVPIPGGTIVPVRHGC